jgi:hypothetical protein
MSRVTYFVRMIAREGKADEVRETLLINYRNIQEERGNVVYALHRSTDNPDEATTRPGRARRRSTPTRPAPGSRSTSRSSVHSSTARPCSSGTPPLSPPSGTRHDRKVEVEVSCLSEIR